MLCLWTDMISASCKGDQVGVISSIGLAKGVDVGTAYLSRIRES